MATLDSKDLKTRLAQNREKFLARPDWKFAHAATVIR